MKEKLIRWNRKVVKKWKDLLMEKREAKKKKRLWNRSRRNFKSFVQMAIVGVVFDKLDSFWMLGIQERYHFQWLIPLRFLLDIDIHMGDHLSISAFSLTIAYPVCRSPPIWCTNWRKVVFISVVGIVDPLSVFIANDNASCNHDLTINQLAMMHSLNNLHSRNNSSAKRSRLHFEAEDKCLDKID